jgi:excisionase family DNA binding protein
VTPDDLLTIKQASEVLQVSEASLRRWTESGRLACLRVGGRRERRFRRVDLMACLETPGADARSSGESAAVAGEVLLDQLRLPRGSHLCDLYESDAGRLRLSVPFLAQGVIHGERCYLVAQPEIAKQILAGVRKVAPGVDDAIEEGRVIVRHGCRRPLDMLKYFRRQFLECSERGATGIRVLGEMSCFLDEGAELDVMMEFEMRYDQPRARPSGRQPVSVRRPSAVGSPGSAC